MYTEINKHPFSQAATLLLTKLDYIMPLGIFIDANFYPVCDNNAPFYVSAITKDSHDKTSIDVSDSTGYIVFQIVIPHDSGTDSADKWYGYGVQQGSFCGTCLLSGQAIDFFSSLPDITDIPAGSLPFSASAVRPVPGTPRATGRIKYEGKPVTGISWGDNLAGGTVESAVIDLNGDTTSPIKTINVNGIELTGDHIFITPKRDSSVRIINADDVKIGRLADL